MTSILCKKVVLWYIGMHKRQLETQKCVKRDRGVFFYANTVPLFHQNQTKHEKEWCYCNFALVVRGNLWKALAARISCDFIILLNLLFKATIRNHGVRRSIKAKVNKRKAIPCLPFKDALRYRPSTTWF